MDILILDVPKQGRMAFVHFAGGRYMYCIGSEDEVRQATETKLGLMIWEALCLATTKGQTVH